MRSAFTAKVLDTVQRTINENGMIAKDDLIICGVSGGPDSVCLLHVLFSLQGKYGFGLHVGYLHHHMRAQADEDAKMVQELAQVLGIPFSIGHEDVPKLAENLKVGLEEAGRMARYAFLQRLKERVGGTKIAVGHNMNDQAETVLMRLLRGSGAQGLAGIPPVNGSLIRPLIDIPRAWTESYCREANLKVISDVYNFDLKYERNMIRHKIMPELITLFNPSLVETLSRTSKVLRWDYELLDSLARAVFSAHSFREGRVTLIEKAPLVDYWPAISSRVLERAWQECSRKNSNLGYNNVTGLLRLASKEKGNLALPLEVMAQVQGDFFGFYPKVEEVDLPLKIPGEIEISEFALTLVTKIRPLEEVFPELGKGTGSTPVSAKLVASKASSLRSEKYFFTVEPKIYVDYNKVEGLLDRLRVRNRRPGDCFAPYGLEGRKKKIQDFFTSARLPRFYRDLVPLLTIDDLVIAVLGQRVADDFKVEPSSEKVLEIEVRPYLRLRQDRATIVESEWMNIRALQNKKGGI